MAKRIPKILPASHLAAMINTTNGKTTIQRRNKALILTLAHAGLRNAEAANLRRADLHLTDSDYPYISVVAGKYDRDRNIPLTPALVEALTTWLSIAPASDYVFCSIRSGRGITAGHEIGQPLTTSTIWKAVKSVATKAGLDPDRVWPHMLRHTAVTSWIEGGFHLHECRDLAGHSNISTTNVYTHTAQSRLAEKMRGLGQ